MRRHPPQKGLCTMCQEVKLISGAKERCDDCQQAKRLESFRAQKNKESKEDKSMYLQAGRVIVKFNGEEVLFMPANINLSWKLADLKTTTCIVCGKECQFNSAWEPADSYKCYCGSECFKKAHEQNPNSEV